MTVNCSPSRVPQPALGTAPTNGSLLSCMTRQLWWLVCRMGRIMGPVSSPLPFEMARVHMGTITEPLPWWWAHMKLSWFWVYEAFVNLEGLILSIVTPGSHQPNSTDGQHEQEVGNQVAGDLWRGRGESNSIGAAEWRTGSQFSWFRLILNFQFAWWKS